MVVVAPLLLSIAPLVAVVAFVFSAQERGAPAKCSTCKDRGATPCSAHTKTDLELEKDCPQCTVAMDCAKCSGAFEIDCPKCDIADARLKKVVAEKTKWRESLEAHEKLFGRELLVAQSAHFEITWDGGRASTGKKVLAPHSAAHLYLDRCEEMYEHFKKVFGCADSDFSTRFRVMVWERYKDQQLAGANYCNQPNPDTSVKSMGSRGVFSIHLDPAKVDPDEDAGADLHRAVAHNVAHLLLANVWNQRWPGELQGGWIDEGVAHYFEDRIDKRCTNFCYREQDTTQSFKGGWWRDPVKKLAVKSDRPPFADTAAKRTDELTIEEHVLAWSYCEFLIKKNGPGFGKICRAIKEGKGYRDAMKSEFGWNALAFEDEWKKHVKTYGK